MRGELKPRGVIVSVLFPGPVMNACRVVEGRIVMFRDFCDRQTVAEPGMGG